MLDKYDFVVAGGGPSGLQFAREIARHSDYSVAVLDANSSLSDNDKSTGGTFDQVIEGYTIPDEVVMDTNQDVIFEGPEASERLPISGYVLDFPNFLEFLGEDAQRMGAEVYTDVRVKGPISRNGNICGVRYQDETGENQLSAAITVDATGPASVLTSQLGMFDQSEAQRGIGKEYEVIGDYDSSSMLFCFDHAVAPGGYAWVFPAGDRVFKAGVCWVDDFFTKHKTDDGQRIDDYVRRWIEEDSRWEMEEIRAVHAGEAVSNNGINSRVTDGLVAVGDSVSSINPLFGEGIRPGMESAEMAADVAIQALNEGDTSRKRLAEYEQRWNNEKGRHWKLQRAVGELFYDFDADQQNRFVKNAGSMSKEQVERLQRYELTLYDYFSIYPFKLTDLIKTPALLRHF